jgi:dTMP kinase
MLNNKLIVIMGPDGTGKSLLSRYLYYVLRKRGMSVCLIYGGWRGFNSVYAQLIKKVYQAIFSKDKIHSSSTKSSRANIAREKKIKSVFKLIVLLDYYVSVIFKLVILLLIYNTVILDRYYIDLIVNMSIDLEENMREMLSTYKVVKPAMPRPGDMFVLIGPPQMIFKRKNDIPSIDFSKEQCRRFLYISMYSQEIQIISALKDLQEKARIVLQKLGIEYESSISH